MGTPIHQHALRLTRWVLGCFVLSMAVATAAPLVQPQSKTLVCTAGGQVKWVTTAQSDPGLALAVSGDGAGTPDSPAGLQWSLGHQTLDCVLCMVLDLPEVPHSPQRLVLAPLQAAQPPFMLPQFAPQRWLRLPARAPPLA